MKLSAKDKVEEVYYTQTGEEQKILYGEKEVDLLLIKNGKRDGKGSKIKG